jgi:hypothetical protein
LLPSLLRQAHRRVIAIGASRSEAGVCNLGSIRKVADRSDPASQLHNGLRYFCAECAWRNRRPAFYRWPQ